MLTTRVCLVNLKMLVKNSEEIPVGNHKLFTSSAFEVEHTQAAARICVLPPHSIRSDTNTFCMQHTHIYTYTCMHDTCIQPCKHVLQAAYMCVYACMCICLRVCVSYTYGNTQVCVYLCNFINTLYLWYWVYAYIYLFLRTITSPCLNTRIDTCEYTDHVSIDNICYIRSSHENCTHTFRTKMRAYNYNNTGICTHITQTHRMHTHRVNHSCCIYTYKHTNWPWTYVWHHIHTHTTAAYMNIHLSVCLYH
jgi:hypothetical protein